MTTAIRCAFTLARGLEASGSQKLTVVDLDKLWKAKREAGYSTNSVRIMRTVLRRALGQAEREGAPLHVVSKILGHASITITKDVYGHLVEGDRRAVAASMSQALFGPESAAVAPSLAPRGTKKAPPRSG